MPLQLEKDLEGSYKQKLDILIKEKIWDNNRNFIVLPREEGAQFAYSVRYSRSKGQYRVKRICRCPVCC